MDALIIVAAGGVGRRLPTLLTHTVTTSPNRIRNSSPPERIRPLPCHGRVGTIRQRSRDKTELYSSSPTRSIQIGTAGPGEWSARSGATVISSAAPIRARSLSLYPLIAHHLLLLGLTRRTPVALPLAPGAQAGVVTACACRTSACVYQGPHINVPSHGFERDSMLMDKPARRCYPCSSDFFCTLAFRSCLTPSAADEASPFRCSTVSFSSFAAVPTSSLAF